MKSVTIRIRICIKIKFLSRIGGVIEDETGTKKVNRT